MANLTFTADDLAPLDGSAGTEEPGKPHAKPCDFCGRDIEPVYAKKLFTMGWMPGPSHTECETASKELDRLQAWLDASKAAGVPLRTRRARFSQLHHQKDEPTWEFMAGISVHAGRIGVLAVNQMATIDVRDWLPGKGWLYIQGDNGTGKSLLASALVNKLVEPPAVEKWSVPTRDEMIIRYGPEMAARLKPTDMGVRRKVVPVTHQVLYVDWPELDRRIELSWNKDKDPLSQAHDCPILVLDDIGTTDGETKISAAKLKTIEKILCSRYRDEKPTIITSNVPWTDIINGQAWGRRVSDRLRECCSPVELNGPSWRTPPERPKAGRMRIVREKAEPIPSAELFGAKDND